MALHFDKEEWDGKSSFNRHHTSKQTYVVCITKTVLLYPCKEEIPVYSDNHVKKGIMCGKIQRVFILIQMVLNTQGNVI